MPEDEENRDKGHGLTDIFFGTLNFDAPELDLSGVEESKKPLWARKDPILEKMLKISEEANRIMPGEPAFKGRNERQMLEISYCKSGVAAFRNKHYEKAIEFFDEGEKLWEGDSELYFIRGLCHIALDNLAKAENDFTDAFKLTPESNSERRALILNSLAWLYIGAHRFHKEKGKKGEANDMLVKAIFTARETIRNTTSLEAKYNLALCLSDSDNKDDIEEAFRIFIDLIQQDKQFLERLKNPKAFDNLRPYFKNSLNSDAGADKTEVSLNLIKDILSSDDHIQIIGLLETDPATLNKARFWELEELREYLPLIKDYLIEVIETSESTKNAEYWYGRSSIILHLDSKLRSKAHKAFCKGANLDPDFEKQDVNAIKTKIKDIFGDKEAEIISILKLRDPIIFPWLIDKL